jgi:hypothetical protein
MIPASALTPIFEAAQAAMLEVTGNPGVTSTPGPSWLPHVTLCYSTSQQPAAPIIAALGKSLPPREVIIDKLTLVIHHGPALSWDWRPIGTAHLGESYQIEPVRESLRDVLSRLSPSPAPKNCAGRSLHRRRPVILDEQERGCLCDSQFRHPQRPSVRNAEYSPSWRDGSIARRRGHLSVMRAPTTAGAKDLPPSSQ